MSDSYSNQNQRNRRDDGGRDGGREGGRGGFRGGRGQGNREQGGFRIRLSDNEMRSARAIQEALNLRSTVAVLGFAVRTIGQMLEDGKLDELVAQHRAQTADSRGGRRDDGGHRSRGQRSDVVNRGPRPDPFARPAKPQPAATADNEQDAESTEAISQVEADANQEEIKDNNNPFIDDIASDQSSSDSLPSHSQADGA